MALDSLDSLTSALAQTSAPQERAQLAGKLRAALGAATASGRGKENVAAAPALRSVALQALKAVQAALQQQKCDGVVELVQLGQASLAALDAQQGGSTSTAKGRSAASATAAAQQQQLAVLRYNFVRRLVALRQYDAALEEGLLLHAQLSAVHHGCEGGRNGGVLRLLPPRGTRPQPDAINLAVGAVLTLVLCCVEGSALGSGVLNTVLQAARDLPAWLNLLKPDEAAKHSEAAYRSLYKGAVAAIERQAWTHGQALTGTLVAASAGGGAAAISQALTAVGKLAVHLPLEQGATLLAELLEDDSELLAAVAEDLLGLLCAAAQRASSSTEALAALRPAVLAAAASPLAVLRQAALLLPALPAAGKGSRTGQQDEEKTAAAVEVAEASLAAVMQHLATAPLPLTELRQHLALLSAAFQAANTLRRLLSSGDRASAQPLVPSTPAMQLVAASTLDLLAGVVGIGASAAKAAGVGPQPFCGQGHAAAVSVVTAARLRGAAGQQSASCALRQVLGWDFAAFCSGGAVPPAAGSCPVQQQELAWLASALFNVGVDLHSVGQYAAAVAPFTDALSAATCCLAQETAPRLADFCKRATALSDAQQRAGGGSAALATLGHSLALATCLGHESAHDWRTLVSAFVRLKAELLVRQAAEAPTPAAVPAARQAKGRGRAAGGRSKASAAAVGSAEGGRAAGAVPGMCLAGFLHAHGASTAQLLLVAEQELQAWGAQASHAELGSASAAEAGRLARYLLSELCPADTQPLAHARLLVLFFQLRQSDGSCAGQQLLAQAVELAERQLTTPEAAAVLGQANALLALSCAQQQVQEALLQQKQQQRRESHAAASTSAAGMPDNERPPEPPLPAINVQSWTPVWQQAERALDQLQNAGAAAVASGAAEAAEQLAHMLSLQGRRGDALLTCLLPACDGELDEVAALQHAVEQLSLSATRTPSSILQRAALHRCAAERLAAGGQLVAALYEAAESHRLASTLFHDGEFDGSTAEPPAGVPGSWWLVAGEYAASLMQLGVLFELAGLPDEALQALREGFRLAASMGSHLLAASFASKLAAIYCNQRDVDRAQQAVEAAGSELAAAEGGPAASVVSQVVSAEQAAVHAAVALAAGDAKAARKHSQAAAACSKLLATEAEGTAMASSAAALHARALLCTAECLAASGDVCGARQQAVAALEVLECSPSGSSTRYWQAAALLFLATQAAELPPEANTPSLAIWGLAAGSTWQPTQPAHAPAAKTARGGRAAAGRTRSKEAPAALEQGAASAGGAGPLQQQRNTWLWRALHLSQELPVLNRRAAMQLAEMCGRAGHLHLAALLLHLSLGVAMRLQYRLVMYTKAQQAAARRRRGAETSDAVEQEATLHELESVLEAGLDWQAVQQLGAAAPGPVPAPAASRGRKTARPAGAAVSSPQPDELLARLEAGAKLVLREWLAAMPHGTAVCGVGASPSGSSIVVCRLAPGVTTPPLLVALPAPPLSASLSKHPIRTLSMEDEPTTSIACGAGGGVASVLGEMEAILADSTRSMRELATDTREQQREWWHARLELDDRLAALLQHLASGWLGPWRWLLLGQLPSQAASAAQRAQQVAESIAAQLLDLAPSSTSCSCHADLQAGVMRAAVDVLVQSSGESGLAAVELEQVVRQLASALGASDRLSAADAKALAAQLSSAGDAAAGDTEEAARGRGGRQGGKSVKFANDASDAKMAEAEVPEPARQTAGHGGKATAGRAGAQARMSAAAAAAAAEMEEQQERSPEATLGGSGATTATEPPQTVARGTDLCRVFDAMHLEEDGQVAQQPPTTAKTASKHRSRLRLMGAATPARPGTGRKPTAAAAGGDSAAVERGAATAPRAPRPVPLSVAKTAPPPAARSSAASAPEQASGRAPVVLALDGCLQALPWESCPGLAAQRLYRVPSLPAAAASASRRESAVADLGSTFYALNPSGDLTATQGAFQDWFASLRGWEGTAGKAPSAAELATALSSRSCFVYLGHGGGDQYIPPSRLRALDRCAASLLMGCSSGRLKTGGAGSGGEGVGVQARQRWQPHYDPAGPVLAYLLAGCPAAVANLWDVTDKDIDRFSQALLTRWLSSSDGGGTAGDEMAAADASGAVAAARGACKLRHLIGAAPVCYGLPTAVRFSS